MKPILEVTWNNIKIPLLMLFIVGVIIIVIHHDKRLEVLEQTPAFLAAREGNVYTVTIPMYTMEKKETTEE